MSTPLSSQYLPQVDKLLRHPEIVANTGKLRREVLVELIRKRLALYRQGFQSCPEDIDEIARQIVKDVKALLKPHLSRVINGTGVILSTNLGRAPLPAKAIANLVEVASHYSNLETDLDSGKRGERTTYIEELLSLLVGSQAACVVNNNAAAVLLAVKALSSDKEVIVSRGELVEIGGSFRLPEVIVAGGGKLKEVGTTNKTRVADYRQAMSKETGILLKCHKSNYQISGFTEEASLTELVLLTEEFDLPLVYDLGSGVLDRLPLAAGMTKESTALIADEPTVADTIGGGACLVTFSGDKLLGGIQAGIICGKRELVAKLRHNPLYRALRPDKVIISLLESVLAQYTLADAEAEIPTLKMLKLSEETLKKRVERFIQKTSSALSQLHLELIACNSTTGGGTLPGLQIPSYGLSIRSDYPANKLAALLRQSIIPIVTIVQNDTVIIDFRTLFEEDEEVLFEALKAVS
jgi:L-seryl-tRNA(Ser) seleniumtransferase